MKLDRNLAIGAAALLLAGAGGAALAHPHPEGDGDGKTVERIVIIRDGKGEHRVDADGARVHTFRMRRDGKGEHGAHMDGVRAFRIHDGALVGCDGGDKIVDETGGDGERKTKVIICSKGGLSAAGAQHLEEALARIKSNEHLSDEQKAKIETALRSAIDRARSAR